MKVLLVNSPFEERYSVGNSKSISYVLNIIPPLGLAYLGSVLEKQDFEVSILDGSIESAPEIFKKIVRDKPEVIGISATTPTFISAKSLAQKIKEALPGTIVVIGGAHVTALPQQAMESVCFDLGVIGEAEETFPELLKHIERKDVSSLGYIKGIIYREDGKLTVTPRREFIRDLDALPYPARHLLPALARYKPTPASYRRLPLGVMMTSRGCPHQCTFCDRAVFGNGYRQRSPDNVLGELDELVNKYGAREVRFFDDCFTLDRERTRKVCAGLRKNRLNISWTCLTAVDSVTKELLKEMKGSGCWQVLFGLESGDEGMLSLLKKGTSLEQNIKAVNWAKEAGLSVRADFIVGTPGETSESLNKTLKFAIDMKLDYAHFNKFMPFPGTEAYKNLTKSGYDFDFEKNVTSITSNEDFLYVPHTVNSAYYKNFINYAYRKFYLRPAYILKRLLSLRTYEEFKGQIRGFLSIFLLGSH